MKGDILRSVLEVAGETAAGIEDLMLAFLTAGYGASYGKLAREFVRYQRARKLRDRERSALLKFQKLVSRLRKDGLLSELQTSDKVIFSLTKKGSEKLNTLQEWRAQRFPAFSYPKESSNELVIVAFDIPEHERKKRDWLRAVLKNIGFAMVQRSVWISKTKIPEEFINDLRMLNLIDCVEIFAVSRSGSLRQLV